MDARVKMIQYTHWPVVTDAHRRAVAAVVDSGAWHYGRVYERLERRLSQMLDRRVLATYSCAWSIFLSLRALRISGPVAVPAYGYHGTVHPIIWAGATPVFVDCDPATFNMCAAHLRTVLRRQPIEAIIGVHIHGLPFDEDIVLLAREFGVPLVEDVCQAQGATLNGKLAGTLGDIAAFSFNSRKTLPAGLGGAVATRSPDLGQKLLELRNYGVEDDDGAPTEIGYYLPISEFDAALTLIQCDMLHSWIKHAETLADILREAIPTRFPRTPTDRTHTWHKVRIRGTVDDRLQLQRAGVMTSTWGKKPLPDYQCYRAYITNPDFPGAADICSNSFCLFNDEFPIVAQSEDTVRLLARTLGTLLP